MSMVDSLFRKGFAGAKCKTLLKLTISRIKLLKNKREIQLKQMRKEIAQFLQAGQEATARIRVEHAIREQNIMAAYEIVELFCELLAVRLPIIEAQRECPLDLREAIASLIFASPRCSDLPELLHIRNLFVAKYGKEFVASATELRPDCGVNRQIIEKLSVRAPAAEAKLNALKEIAEEYEVEWDSSATESEFLKLHEDLLDGSNHIFSGTKVPLVQEEEDESHFTPIKLPDKVASSETGSAVLVLPEVPRGPITQRQDAQIGAVTGLQNAATASHRIAPVSSESTCSGGQQDTFLQIASIGLDVPVVNSSSQTLSSCAFSDIYRERQFIPFVSSPPPLMTANREGRVSTHSISSSKAEASKGLQDVMAAAQAAVASADHAAAVARAAADLAKVRIFELSAKRDYGNSEGVDESTYLEGQR